VSPFAPQKCVGTAHFRGAKGDKDEITANEAKATLERPMPRARVELPLDPMVEELKAWAGFDDADEERWAVRPRPL